MTIKVLGSSSSGNCYVVEDCGEKLILDAGVKYTEVMRAIDWQTESVAGCLVTHKHSDHCAAAEKLARIVRTASCQEVANQLQSSCEVLHENKAYLFGGYIDEQRFAYKVVPFHVPHGGTENFAYVIWTPSGNRLLYATDYEYIPLNFQSVRLTHMMIECNYTDRDKLKGLEKYEHVARGHAALDTALGVVEANRTEDLKAVIICHVSASEDGESIRAQVQELVGDTVTVTVAEKGGNYEW